MQTYITFMGSDFIVDIDWTLTHRGSAPRSDGPNSRPEDYDPGSDPEWDVNSITLTEDRGEPAPAFKATGALFDLLSTSRAVDDAILEYIGEYDEDEDSYFDEDYHRERYDYSDLPDWD